MGRLPRFRNHPLVVVGGGDSAIEEATYLTKYASVVHLVHRRDELRASRIMQQRALDNPKIDIVWNHVIDEVLGSDAEGVTAVRVRSTTGQDDARVGQQRHVSGDRPHAQHGVSAGKTGDHRQGLHPVDDRLSHEHQRGRGVCRGRCGGRLLPSGDHVGRDRLHGGLDAERYLAAHGL